MWITDESTNEVDTLEAMVLAATQPHVASITLVSGGSGYAKDEVIEIDGGTPSFTAKIRALEVDGSGAIVRGHIHSAGSYSVAPGLTAATTTSAPGGGSGATFDLTTGNTGWIVARKEFKVQEVEVVDGGSSYGVNQTLTIDGPARTSATLRVVSVSAGVITGVRLENNGGFYDAELPDVSTSTRITGGGSGATFRVLSYSVIQSLQGPGDGTESINVSVRTYQGLNASNNKTTYNWALFASSDFVSGLRHYEQPDISPGYNNTPTGDPNFQTLIGAYVPLRDADVNYPIRFWFNITPRRIVGALRVDGPLSTIYPSFYLGYLNPLGTSAEAPFPMYVSGASHRNAVYYEDSTAYITGLSSMDGGLGDAGPGFQFRTAFSAWAGVNNSSVSTTGTSRATDSDSGVYPGGFINQTPEDTGFLNVVSSGWATWRSFIPDTGVPGNAVWQLYPSPDGADGSFPRIPCTVIDADDNSKVYRTYGELSHVFWVPRADTIISEDTLTDEQGVIYRIFQNGNRTSDFNYMCIQETF